MVLNGKDQREASIKIEIFLKGYAPVSHPISAYDHYTVMVKLFYLNNIKLYISYYIIQVVIF